VIARASSPSPAGALGYRPALDGMRGLSVLAVIAYHGRIFGLRNGFLGVDIFFVLSGFLITTLLVEEWHSRRDIRFGRFYMRRILRLFPALAALVVLYALVADWRPALVAGLYVTNWAAALWGYSPGYLGHTWSLAIEEQFYLLWPPLLYLLLRCGVSRRALVGAALGGAAAAAGLRAWLWAHGASAGRVHYGLDVRADSLLVGAAAGLAWAGGWLPRAGTGLRVAGALAVAVLIGCLLRDPSTETFFYRGGYTLVALAAAVWMTAVLRRPPAPLTHPALLWIGRRSYGLYLWHYPILRWFAGRGWPLAVGIALSFAVAAASFVWIEQPFLRLKRRYRAA
jgi:peptidoglycan/LPS O-acetylase OafA/YrhL